ncbi:MAG: hypothetical protein E5V92_09265 [Mesorhizobium sp.]|nr:hypothetical protein EJ067_14765 [Mesorhizobium sp. M1D.F.Ca.ET.043.01.1.1]RWA89917.1 MAG: hypothetical protein EOQ32_19900 [Mesorhizobium sp.]RWE04505.1 MAG: hypothetical protein EOS61_25645 [Mesorhizobium sp.]TJW87536.1 MAG: hypothetical protein E5V92_09265 [Mesorhizobium sp.]
MIGHDCPLARGRRNASAWPERISDLPARAIPGKVRSGFPSGIAQKQRDRAIPGKCGAILRPELRKKQRDKAVICGRARLWLSRPSDRSPG